MRRVVAMVLLVVGVVGMLGQVAAPEGGALGVVRFVPVDVVIDSGKAGLGAYQVEVTALEGVKIVGLEGAEAGVFKEAPFYDPAALAGGVGGERIVIAAFSTEGAARLPRGNVKVARVHLTAPERVDDAALERMTSKLVVATDGDGKSIAAKLSLRVYRAAAEGEKR